jgi:predicted transcriptional regulator
MSSGFKVLRKIRMELSFKFASSHVLSPEGSRGLTVLELADKTQVSSFVSQN